MFERPGGGWRRILALHRLGVPAIDLPRRLLYDLCVLSAKRSEKTDSIDIGKLGKK